jgi:hypothetical protein
MHFTIIDLIHKEINMKFRRIVPALAVTLAVLSATPLAHANIIERILANPKIQALLGRPGDITGMLERCKNPNYQRVNQQACAEAQQADMMMKLPHEMRTVMSNPRSAQSLRDLCLAVQNMPQRESFLCAELTRADQNFAALAGERQRIDSGNYRSLGSN